MDKIVVEVDGRVQTIWLTGEQVNRVTLFCDNGNGTYDAATLYENEEGA